MNGLTPVSPESVGRLIREFLKIQGLDMDSK